MKSILAAAFTLSFLFSGMALASDTVVDTIKETVTIPKGTTWDSPSKAAEVCDFALRIDYDELIETTTFEDGHQVLHLVFSDKFTNLKSGFWFYDTADYYVKYDPVSGWAFHAGVFWKTVIQGRLAVLDRGTFEQNWNLPGVQTPEQLTGPDHDVNAFPHGTISYCDWLSGDFPRANFGKDPHHPRGH
jgi:hypothetical protein